VGIGGSRADRAVRGTGELDTLRALELRLHTETGRHAGGSRTVSG
jgi:hypothetical protein